MSEQTIGPKSVKRAAKTLQGVMKEVGVDVELSRCREATSKLLDARDWNTLLGVDKTEEAKQKTPELTTIKEGLRISGTALAKAGMSNRTSSLISTFLQENSGFLLRWVYEPIAEEIHPDLAYAIFNSEFGDVRSILDEEKFGVTQDEVDNILNMLEDCVEGATFTYSANDGWSFKECEDEPPYFIKDEIKKKTYHTGPESTVTVSTNAVGKPIADMLDTLIDIVSKESAGQESTIILDAEECRTLLGYDLSRIQEVRHLNSTLRALVNLMFTQNVKRGGEQPAAFGLSFTAVHDYVIHTGTDGRAYKVSIAPNIKLPPTNRDMASAALKKIARDFLAD